MKKVLFKKFNSVMVITLVIILVIGQLGSSFALVGRTSKKAAPPITTVKKKVVKKKAVTTVKKKAAPVVKKKETITANKKASDKDKKSKKKDDTPKNILNKKKEYSLGTMDEDVFITSPNVTLKDTDINGDLFIEKSVNNGGIHLEGVSVSGNLYINGGGSSPIVLEDSTFEEVNVDESKGKVKIIAKGSTHAKKLLMHSGGEVMEKDVWDLFAFDEVEIDSEGKAGQRVTLSGDYKEVNLNSKSANLKLSSGRVENLVLGDDTSDTSIGLEASSTIGVIDAVSGIKFTGKGNIDKLIVDNKGVLISLEGSIACKTLKIGGNSKSSIIVLGSNSKIEDLSVIGSANIAGKGKVSYVNVEGRSTDLDILGATIIDELIIKQSASKAGVNLANNTLARKIAIYADAEVVGEGTIETAEIYSDCTISIPVRYVVNSEKYKVNNLKVVGSVSDVDGKWVMLEVQVPYDNKTSPRTMVKAIMGGSYLQNFEILFDKSQAASTSLGIVEINKSILQKNRLYIKFNDSLYNVAITYRMEDPPKPILPIIPPIQESVEELLNVNP